MTQIYLIAGISKQGFHQWLNRIINVKEEQMQLLPIIRQIRSDHPRLSCREIYYMLKPCYMGRDRFEEYCYQHGFKIEISKSKYKTTDSLGVIRFPNLLMSTEELTGINQVWVSDITYYSIQDRVYYLTFITDLYSRNIVGFKASETLTTKDTTLKALRMAIKNRSIQSGSNLIIHSDGGGQYYCKEFLKITKKYGMQNSMGKSVYENSHAERINGIIKNDYLVYSEPKNFCDLEKMLIKAVYLYNEKRPHKSLKRLTPAMFESITSAGLLTMKWVINKKKKVSKKEKVNINIIYT